MPKRKDLNGLPHDLAQSYFSDRWFDGQCNMADYLLNAVKVLRVNTVTLDILKLKIDPPEMEKLPLLQQLKSLKGMVEMSVMHKGWDVGFIVDAVIRVDIPDIKLYTRTLYCYLKLVDEEGREYTTDRIIITASMDEFDPFAKRSIRKSFWDRIKGILK